VSTHQMVSEINQLESEVDNLRKVAKQLADLRK
jgi:uncharacterized protein Yka (UPF0111/DUF47 family)